MLYSLVQTTLTSTQLYDVYDALPTTKPFVLHAPNPLVPWLVYSAAALASASCSIGGSLYRSCEV